MANYKVRHMFDVIVVNAVNDAVSKPESSNQLYSLQGNPAVKRCGPSTSGQFDNANNLGQIFPPRENIAHSFLTKVKITLIIKTW